MGAVLVAVILISLVNMIADISQGVLDPRAHVTLFAPGTVYCWHSGMPVGYVIRDDPVISGDATRLGGLVLRPAAISAGRGRPMATGTVCLANVAAMSNDLPDLRASHADRDRVVDALRVAAGDGRLSAEELDTRLESALSARTLGELAELTADLPITPAAKGKDVLVVEQHGGRYVREGRWSVPVRIELRTQECRVTLDFTHAVITSNVLRIETDMVHGKLFIVSWPGIVIDTDGLNLTYSKLKIHSENAAGDPRLRIELVGKLLHAKVIEQRP